MRRSATRSVAILANQPPLAKAQQLLQGGDAKGAVAAFTEAINHDPAITYIQTGNQIPGRLGAPFSGEKVAGRRLCRRFAHVPDEPCCRIGSKLADGHAAKAT